MLLLSLRLGGKPLLTFKYEPIVVMLVFSPQK